MSNTHMSDRPGPHKIDSRSLFDGDLVRQAILASFVKLDPRTLVKNPIMFVVEVVASLTSVILIRDAAIGAGQVGFTAQIVGWLWFTILFANFAEAIAEGRGKAQADALRRTRSEATAKRLLRAGDLEVVAASALKVDDIVLVETG
ncbi:MAG TPA: hypothetical protein VMR03_13350, partial [Parvibaculum sp.]|nr:hypothetical protein [Parvibaculum sp.]